MENVSYEDELHEAKVEQVFVNIRLDNARVCSNWKWFVIGQISAKVHGFFPALTSVGGWCGDRWIVRRQKCVLK